MTPIKVTCPYCGRSVGALLHISGTQVRIECHPHPVDPHRNCPSSDSVYNLPAWEATAKSGVSTPPEVSSWSREDLIAAVRELRAWQQVAIESNKAVDAYLRSVNSQLPEQYGMPVDGVRRVLEPLREEAEKWRTAAAVLCGKHVGQPQVDCPVCIRDALQQQRKLLEADLERTNKALAGMQKQLTTVAAEAEKRAAECDYARSQVKALKRDLQQAYSLLAARAAEDRQYGRTPPSDDRTLQDPFLEALAQVLGWLAMHAPGDFRIEIRSRKESWPLPVPQIKLEARGNCRGLVIVLDRMAGMPDNILAARAAVKLHANHFLQLGFLAAPATEPHSSAGYMPEAAPDAKNAGKAGDKQ